jgi:hypothetical protein
MTCKKHLKSLNKRFDANEEKSLNSLNHWNKEKQTTKLYEIKLNNLKF